MLLSAYCLLNFEWSGKKREDENERRNQGENLSFLPERFHRLDDLGVAKTKKKQDHRPGYPTIPAEVSKRQQDEEESSREIPASIARTA